MFREAKKHFAKTFGPGLISKAAFPAGEFVRIESHQTSDLESLTRPLPIFRLRGDNLYTVTFICDPTHKAAFSAKAKSIMQTFRYQ